MALWCIINWPLLVDLYSIQNMYVCHCFIGKCIYLNEYLIKCVLYHLSLQASEDMYFEKSRLTSYQQMISAMDSEFDKQCLKSILADMLPDSVCRKYVVICISLALNLQLVISKT